MEKMLKRIWTVAIATTAVVVGSFSSAQTDLALPKGEWVLAFSEAPLQQREAVLNIEEGPFYKSIVSLLEQANFSAAIAQIRTRFPFVVANIEAGREIKPDANGKFELSAALLYVIGHIYVGLEMEDAAITAFKSALIQMPDYTRAHEAIGILNLKNENYENARTYLARAVELGLDTGAVYSSLGYLNQQVNNYWGAAAAYQRALMLDPSNQNWQQGLLHALVNSKSYDTASGLVEEQLQSRPDDANLWLYRAHIANFLKDKETALASLETAIRLGKDSKSYLQACANLHMQLGSTDRAIALIKTGVVQEMDFDFVDQAIHWLIENERWQGAEDLTTDLKTRWANLSDTNKSALLVNESRILQNKKDDARAAQLLQQALELNGGNVPALMTLAGIQLKNKNYPRAEILYQRASAYPSHRENALIALAQIAIDTQNYQKALELLQEVIRIDPDQIEIKRNIQSLENLVLLES